MQIWAMPKADELVGYTSNKVHLMVDVVYYSNNGELITEGIIWLN